MILEYTEGINDIDLAAYAANMNEQIAGIQRASEIDALMEKANQDIGGYGVEALRSGQSDSIDFWDDAYGDTYALYVNLGTSDDYTIIYDVEEEEFLASDIETFVTKKENKPNSKNIKNKLMPEAIKLGFDITYVSMSILNDIKIEGKFSDSPEYTAGKVLDSPEVYGDKLVASAKGLLEGDVHEFDFEDELIEYFAEKAKGL
jgi:hypothetical protein